MYQESIQDTKLKAIAKVDEIYCLYLVNHRNYTHCMYIIDNNIQKISIALLCFTSTLLETG
jgi:hypothetical protein